MRLEHRQNAFRSGYEKKDEKAASSDRFQPHQTTACLRPAWLFRQGPLSASWEKTEERKMGCAFSKLPGKFSQRRDATIIKASVLRRPSPELDASARFVRFTEGEERGEMCFARRPNSYPGLCIRRPERGRGEISVELPSFYCGLPLFL